MSIFVERAIKKERTRHPTPPPKKLETNSNISFTPSKTNLLQCYNLQVTNYKLLITSYSFTIYKLQLYNLQVTALQFTSYSFTIYSFTIYKLQLYNLQVTALQVTALQFTKFTSFARSTTEQMLALVNYLLVNAHIKILKLEHFYRRYIVYASVRSTYVNT
jgi:hypothetical protein